VLSSAIFNDYTVSCYLFEENGVNRHLSNRRTSVYMALDLRGPYPRKIGLQDILAVRVDYVQPTAHLTDHDKINEFWETKGSLTLTQWAQLETNKHKHVCL